LTPRETETPVNEPRPARPRRRPGSSLTALTSRGACAGSLVIRQRSPASGLRGGETKERRRPSRGHSLHCGFGHAPLRWERIGRCLCVHRSCGAGDGCVSDVYGIGRKHPVATIQRKRPPVGRCCLWRVYSFARASHGRPCSNANAGGERGRERRLGGTPVSARTTAFARTNAAGTNSPGTYFLLRSSRSGPPSGFRRTESRL
jgi:hypothetical protein